MTTEEFARKTRKRLPFFLNCTCNDLRLENVQAGGFGPAGSAHHRTGIWRFWAKAAGKRGGTISWGQAVNRERGAAFATA